MSMLLISTKPASYLRRIIYDGAGRRSPESVSAKVEAQIEHEHGVSETGCRALD